MRQVWNLTLAELRRFRGPLPILSAVFLVCVPLLYGAIYLWSNWDPYGRLGELKVAVVNLDEPVTHDGKNVQGGKDLVDQLVADDSSFAWRVVDQRAAAAGVADGSYAFSITVPKTFSADLASIGTENGPRRARVDVAFDNSQGYILGIMAETAEKELQSQLNAAAVKAYADAALGSIGQLRTGLAEAAAAGDKLSDGSRQVADGVQNLEDKVKPVVNRVSKGLTAAAKEAASVTKEVATTTADIASLAKDADGKQNEVQDALDALLAAHPELADETVVKDLRTAVKRVTTVSGEVKKVTGRVASDAKRVAGVAADVNARVPEIIGAANTAVDKVDELRSGAQKVSDGQAKLTTGLKRATGALPKLSAAERAKDADALANPVHIASHVANPAVYYGRGLAPFFFGIALWVFGLVAFVLMRAISTRGIASGTNPVLVALGGWLPPALLGSAGALLLLGVTDLALGLNPVDLTGTAAVSVLAVAAFTALAQALRVWLGLVGSAIMLVILIVQLGGAGGLYPVAVMPAFFQVVHPFLPMTYLVEALRVGITGGAQSQFAMGVMVLAGVLLVSLFATAIGAWRQRVWTPLRLRPPLEE